MGGHRYTGICIDNPEYVYMGIQDYTWVQGIGIGECET